MTSVLVSASGRSSRPVSPVNANTGKNDSAVMSSEVRMAGANDCAAASNLARRSSADARGATVSSRRCEASSATMSASTAIPSAIPIPPRLMMVAGTPRIHMAPNVSSRTTGSVSEGDHRAAHREQEQQETEDHHADLLGERAQERVRARGSPAPSGRRW